MSLDTVQRWMQDVIVDPRGDDAVEGDHVAAAARWIKPSATLQPYERVAVYRDMYLLRMEEALQADFPALERFVGHRGFHRLVAEYVQAHPSTSYNLSRLSDLLPDFVARWDGIKRRGFAADLARLELAITLVFDMPPSASLTREALDAVPPDAWDRARLRPIEALRLMAFDYPVNVFLQAVVDEGELPSTARRASWVAIYRQGYAMARLSLSRPQFAVLEALHRGETLYEAFSRGTQGRGHANPQDVLAWITRWVSEGMFAKVVLDPVN